MKIYTISNQKGGVAKTTTTINLAAALVLFEKRCLVIDLDPQAQLTDGLGVAAPAITTYHVMVEGEPLREAIVTTQWEGLDLVPASIILANAELHIGGRISRESILKNAIKKAQLTDEYDYILIDTSPTLGVLNLNAMSAAHGVIIPVEPSKFSLDAVQMQEQTIGLLQEISSVRIEGILITRVPPRSKEKDYCFEQLEAAYGDLVFKTTISANEKVKESQRFSQPLVFYDPKAAAAIQYIELAKELLENGG